MKTASNDAEAKGREAASAQIALDSPARRSMRSVKSAATIFVLESYEAKSFAKSPVPHAKSRTVASVGRTARATANRFHRPSIPYEKRRVIRSYLGAIVENISRMRRLSCFSGGTVRRNGDYSKRANPTGCHVPHLKFGISAFDSGQVWKTAGGQADLWRGVYDRHRPSLGPKPKTCFSYPASVRRWRAAARGIGTAAALAAS